MFAIGVGEVFCQDVFLARHNGSEVSLSARTFCYDVMPKYDADAANAANRDNWYDYTSAKYERDLDQYMRQISQSNFQTAATLLQKEMEGSKAKAAPGAPDGLVNVIVDCMAFVPGLKELKDLAGTLKDSYSYLENVFKFFSEDVAPSSSGSDWDSVLEQLVAGATRTWSKQTSRITEAGTAYDAELDKCNGVQSCLDNVNKLHFDAANALMRNVRPLEYVIVSLFQEFMSKTNPRVVIKLWSGSGDSRCPAQEATYTMCSGGAFPDEQATLKKLVGWSANCLWTTNFGFDTRCGTISDTWQPEAGGGGQCKLSTNYPVSCDDDNTYMKIGINDNIQACSSPFH